jgi:hypothetical protein
MLVGSIACSCGRHLTWSCECGAVSYGPALTSGCSLLDGPARERGGPLPSIDVALWRSDHEEAPFAGHALELVSAAILELES